MAESDQAAVAVAFKVTIDGQSLGFFTACDGLGCEITIEQKEEGGNLAFIHQLPGRVKFTNVKLTRVDSGAVLLDDHFDLPFPDGTFPFQVVPVLLLTGVDVTSAAVDGLNAAITLYGAGFIE